MSGTVVHEGWRIELLASGNGWTFTAYKLKAKPGELERLKALSVYGSKDEALAEARSMVDREPWKRKPE